MSVIQNTTSIADNSLISHNSQVSRYGTDLAERRPDRMTRGATGISSSSTEDNDKKWELRHHLERVQPFNDRWIIKEFLCEGSFGSVISVEEHLEGDKVQEAVLKVSKGEKNNQEAEWESIIYRRIQQTNPEAAVVRLLDAGTLANYDEDHLKFLVLEKCEIRVDDYLKGTTGAERQERVCQIALGMLHGLHDIHKMGIVHRDVKWQNCGLIEDSDGQIKVMLFDFGNARFFTDDAGNIIPPRTTTRYYGTKEYSSNWADDMREQTRWDDLFSWFYSAIDMMYPHEGANDSPMPWTWANGISHHRAATFLKGAFMPAFVTLRKCPMPFYAINSYLHTAPRHQKPDYAWLFKKMTEAKTYVPANTSGNSKTE